MGMKPQLRKMYQTKNGALASRKHFREKNKQKAGLSEKNKKAFIQNSQWVALRVEICGHSHYRKTTNLSKKTKQNLKQRKK